MCMFVQTPSRQHLHGQLADRAQTSSDISDEQRKIEESVCFVSCCHQNDYPFFATTCRTHLQTALFISCQRGAGFTTGAIEVENVKELFLERR